jgi:hypothetical protein
MRSHHELKCETGPYQAVEKEIKTFEFRKNDRDFKLYDMVILKETVNGIYTGRHSKQFEIIYILYGPDWGIPIDYCVFQMK